MRIGIVGLGRMGAAIAQRLRQDGFELVAWDQRAQANEDGLGGHEDVIASGVAATTRRPINAPLPLC